ncbi:hemerythrin domain-containing protein [Thalassotalea psychrophila]|uniref:Hemerythrin domain-containing protein n=1 Tax=Thalassotalea psychrophila TaxID=3065647 RepID=A0ABY9TT85_9GAMM|nr:hemerythrin domain-containing protein [Colwelliaceae bacterium SQ149]
MNAIPDYMTDKHRHCDDIFAEAEAEVAKENWILAEQKWQTFTRELELHLQAEEQILFPEFEQATGMTSGPTQVMRMEHEQMRGLLTSLNKSLVEKNSEDFLGFSETLMVLMQQHNMKEEMMLYPMCQQNISDTEQMTAQLKQHCD